MVNSIAELDQSFLALSHPIRRTIVERLVDGPATVGEAARGSGVSKPAISKHLKVLEEAGLVERRVQGRSHRLTLRTQPLADASEWMEHQRELWERKLDVVEQFLDQKRRRKPPGKDER